MIYNSPTKTKSPKKWPLDKSKVARVKRIFNKIGLRGSNIPNAKKYVGFYRIYTENLHVTELVQAHGEIPRHLMKELKKDFNYWNQQPAINLGLTSEALSLADLQMIWLPMKASRHQLDKGTELYTLIESAGEMISDTYSLTIMAMHTAMSRMLLAHSNLTGIGFLTYDTQTGNQSRYGELYRNRMMVSLKVPDKRFVTIQNRKRTIYEVIFYHKCLFGYETLNIDHNGTELPCYIQSHAYNRIPERFDICKDFIARESAFELVKNSSTIQYRGTTLLPLSIEDKRIGYFVCEIIDDIIVLKTFLLVTHLGTPEGDIFTEMTEIDKENLSTMKLDCLSSFTGKAFREDSLVHEIIMKSNLSYLVTMNLKEMLMPPHLKFDTIKNMNGDPLLVLGRE